jgi:hypothetical protein
MITSNSAIGTSAVAASGSVELPEAYGYIRSIGRGFGQTAIGNIPVVGAITSSNRAFNQSISAGVLPDIITGVGESSGSSFSTNAIANIIIDNITGSAVSTAPGFTQTVIGSLKKDHFGPITSTGRTFRVRLKGYGGPLSGLPQDIVLNDGCHSTNLIQIPSANITGELTMKVQELEAQYACQ